MYQLYGYMARGPGCLCAGASGCLLSRTPGIAPPHSGAPGATNRTASIRGPQDRPFQMRVSEDFWRTVDDWRRGQTDLPSRAEAIRRMVELAAKMKKKPDRRKSVCAYW